MASYRDLLDAIARVGAATGNPDAWKDGLTGADVAVACTPTSPPAAVDAVLSKLTAAHPAVFVPATVHGQPPPAAQGAAADAIRGAESQLARQRSEAAHVDLQVLTAIVNAHATASEGLAQLAHLQRDIEAAVASRTDLDTPAGARELQRYFISKMRDIRDVVEHAGLDASSRAALAEALVVLYAAATPATPGDVPVIRSENASPSTMKRSDSALDDAGLDLPKDLSTDFPLPDESPLAAPDSVVPDLAAPPYSAMPAAPFGAMPAAPFGAMPAAPFGAMPLGAPSNGGLPNVGSAPGLSGTHWPDLSPAELTVPDRVGDDARDGEAAPSAGEPKDNHDDTATETADAEQDSNATHTDPTPVLLPDGQTVIAPSPELASAITAAVAGAPIATAFSWQGIAIPAPGSPVTVPVDPARLVPGDVGVLADRHALALGSGKALLDNRIQPISSVMGPGFLGWQHPPAPDPMNTPPVSPVPDRSPATAPS